MDRLLIFGGTTEGRLLSEYLMKNRIPATVCVATEYGESQIEGKEPLEIVTGRMDKEEISRFLRKGKFNFVIDATHPYAALVTDNIKEACMENKIERIRLIRESIEEKDALYFNSIDEIIEYLNQHEGRAFITTGGKDIKPYTRVRDYKTRLTLRVLPETEIIEKCKESGFLGKNLICMQGPFSEAMNELMLKEYAASYLVTKEAGTYGGFLEKVNAAKKAGAKVLVLKRPGKEEGLYLKEVTLLLEKKRGLWL